MQSEKLWTRLLAQLTRRRELPLGSEYLTPHEIAIRYRQTAGDDRVRRFVCDYYYPHHFGLTMSALSEAEAEALVASFEPGAKAVRPPASASPDSSPAAAAARPLCQICEHRPVPVPPS